MEKRSVKRGQSSIPVPCVELEMKQGGDFWIGLNHRRKKKKKGIERDQVSPFIGNIDSRSMSI